jgi:ABC-type enterochelin transport system permease subunit
MKYNNIARNILLVLSIGLYIASLTQPAYCTNAECADSAAVAFAGSLGFFLSMAGATWLANPLLVASWIVVHKNPLGSLITSLLATALSLSFLCFNTIVDNESGTPSNIAGVKAGYWLWVTSIAVMFIGNAAIYYRRLKTATV